MELAVLALNGTEERLRWESLVQPREHVPFFIRRLTGIDDRMLRDAPIFPEVVRTVETLTRATQSLVAHNVRFDMTALSHEFARTGLVFERSTLCTERLSRRLVPLVRALQPGSLCRSPSGVPFAAAHRALNDAEAAAGVLMKLIDAFGEQEVMRSVTLWSFRRWNGAAMRA